MKKDILIVCGFIILIMIFYYLNNNLKYGDLNHDMKYIVSNIDENDKMTIQIRINVGSRDEDKSVSGISHLLEHMFFQGSKKYPSSKDIQQSIYECGGIFNATTDMNKTIYYIKASNSCIEESLDIISDSLYNSLFDETKLENEKKVVINELNDMLSKPKSLSSLGLQEIMFKNTRLEKNIAGDIESIKNITSDMLKNYINTYYKNNIIVSLTSPLNVNKGYELIEKYFNKLPQYEVKNIPNIIKDKKRIFYPDILFKKTAKSIKYIKDDSEQSFITMSFPSFKYKEYHKNYYMIIISEILTGWKQSKLYKILREDYGLLYSIKSGNVSFEDLGYFYIKFSTKNNKEIVNRCINLILDTLFNLYKNITKEEFYSSKSHMIENIKLKKDEPYYLNSLYTRDFYYLDKIYTLDDKIKTIEKIQLKNLKNISEEVFKKELYCISYTGLDKYL